MRGKEILGKTLLAAAFAGATLAVAAVVFLGPRSGGGGRGVGIGARRGFPPLHLAARSGSIEAVTVLLDNGAGLEELDRGPNGWTPLLHAIHKDQLAVVRLLLARGADPNRLAVNGTSPLNLAASQGDLATVRILIAAGARVHGRSGAAALLNAATGGHTRVVRTLLEADPSLRVRTGPRYWVARALAHFRGDRAMLGLLRRVEARS